MSHKRIEFYAFSERGKVKLFLETLGLHYRESRKWFFSTDPLPSYQVDSILASARMDNINDIHISNVDD